MHIVAFGSYAWFTIWHLTEGRDGTLTPLPNIFPRVCRNGIPAPANQPPQNAYTLILSLSEREREANGAKRGRYTCSIRPDNLHHPSPPFESACGGKIAGAAGRVIKVYAFPKPPYFMWIIPITVSEKLYCRREMFCNLKANSTNCCDVLQSQLPDANQQLVYLAHLLELSIFHLCLSPTFSYSRCLNQTLSARLHHGLLFWLCGFRSAWLLHSKISNAMMMMIWWYAAPNAPT